MAQPFFTIGHSNRSLDAFVELLGDAGIELVADVRRVPMSRSNPQFNQDMLPEALLSLGIAYEHMAKLGGLRGKARGVPLEVNGFWSNGSFHNYADYALSEAFHAGLSHLREQGHRRRVAVMCSEAVWWRCHRRIIADHLIANGEAVFHLLGPGRVEPARLTAGGVVQSDGTVVYPAGE